MIVVHIGARADDMYLILVPNKKTFSKKVYGEMGSLNPHGDVHGEIDDKEVVIKELKRSIIQHIKIKNSIATYSYFTAMPIAVEKIFIS